MRRVLVLFFVLAAVAAATSAPTSAFTEAKTFLAFKSPSGSITCVMSIRDDDGRFAQCELASNDTGYSLRPKGRVRLYDRAGYDDLAGQRLVLPYRRSLRLGIFTCTSRTSAMICRSSISGHGFSISRERQRIF